jgi:hypothetical protein
MAGLARGVLLLMLGCTKEPAEPEARDEDGDGYAVGEDCDDGDAAVHPAAEERCDGRDDDCDGSIDEEAVDARTLYLDRDGDGYGGGEGESTCLSWPGWVEQTGDCDDSDPAVNPSAQEVCGGVDDDCDGWVDDADPDVEVDAPVVTYPDGDGDGHGVEGATTTRCAPGDGWAAGAPDDCDDGDPAVYPGAPELCDEQDQDCDGALDEGMACPIDDVAVAWLYGEFEDEYVGQDLAIVPDITGDGLPDVLVGAGSKVPSGGLFAFSGLPTGARGLLTADLIVQNTTSTSPYLVLGTGLEVVDTDLDGVHELVVGDINYDGSGSPRGGVAWFAPAQSGVVEFESARSILVGDKKYGSGYLGYAMATANVTGSGDKDLLVGDSASEAFVDQAGAVHVVVGPPPAGYWTLSEVTTTFTGEYGFDAAGTSVAAADLNGDGLDDAIMGAPIQSDFKGVVYVVYGPLDGRGTLSLADSDAQIEGPYNGGFLGEDVAALGDVNGDGRDDFGMPAVYQAFVFSEPPAGIGYPEGMATARLLFDEVAGGFDENSRNYPGTIGTAGDPDLDGDDDLIVGYPSTAGGGRVTFVASPLSGVVDIATISYSLVGDPDGGSQGLGDGLSRRVADVDGDGVPDYLVGAPYESAVAPHGGGAYLISGASIPWERLGL